MTYKTIVVELHKLDQSLNEWAMDGWRVHTVWPVIVAGHPSEHRVNVLFER